MTDVLSRGKWLEDDGHPEKASNNKRRTRTRSRTARDCVVSEQQATKLALLRRCFVLCVRLEPSTCFTAQTSCEAAWLHSASHGVAVHCADCGSSNSDITEPCSPLSTTSLDEMPPTAVGRSTGAPASVVRRPPPPPSPVGDTNSVQWPWTDPPNKRPKQGKITEYFRAKGGNKGSMLAAANVASLNKESAVQQPWVTSPVSKFLSASVKSGVTLTSASAAAELGVVMGREGGGGGGEDFDEDEEDENSSNSRSITAALQTSCSEEAATAAAVRSTPIMVDNATGISPPSMAASPICTLVADNAEENSSSGASDVSSLFTSTTTRTTDSDVNRQLRQQHHHHHHQQQQQQQQQQEQERTIRFPVKNGWRGHYVSDVVCRWTDCEAKFTTSTALLEHLQINHVNSQTLSENYVCRWSDCKVYERKSCSRTWLERHVLSHGGNKPYRCIVDGCGHRFSSQTLLQRHVNNHFSERDQKGDSKKGCETANKLIRRNGKRLRYRRQPFSARIYDYFDTGIMEGLQHKLIELTERRTNGQFDNVGGDSVLLQSRILGRRTDEKGETQVLLRWFPGNVINDEWVGVDEVTRTKNVQIRRLPIQAKDTLYKYLLNETRRPETPQLSVDRRRRRKQTSSYRSATSVDGYVNNSSIFNGCSPASSSSSLTEDHLSSSFSSPSSSSSPPSSSSSRQTLPSSVPLPSKSTTTVLSMRTT